MCVNVSRDDNICTITIDRPEALNALNTRILDQLDETLDVIAADSELMVVIVTGAGDRAFVAGADIAEMRDMGTDQAREFARRGQRVFNKLSALPQVSIAAVNGFALGGGCELALACDMRLAAETAKFGEPEVSLGIIPGFAGTQRLPRLVGSAKAFEMILTGETVGAKEALSCGLVNKVVPADALRGEALRLAGMITANGPHAVRMAKKAVSAARDADLATGCEIEASLFASCFGDEQHERMTAFLEKRKK